jgi:hypothetical protein
MRCPPIPSTLRHWMAPSMAPSMAHPFRSYVSYDRHQAPFARHLTRALRRHGFHVDEDPLDALAGDEFAWEIGGFYLFRGDALIFVLAAEKLTRPEIAPVIETLRFYGDHQHMRILIVAVGPADLVPHRDLVHIETPEPDYARARKLAREIQKHDLHEPRRSRKKLTPEELVVLRRMKWDVGIDPELVGSVRSMAMVTGLPEHAVASAVHSLHERGLFRRHELCPATPTSQPEYWFDLTPRGKSFVLPART